MQSNQTFYKDKVKHIIICKQCNWGTVESEDIKRLLETFPKVYCIKNKEK